MFTNRRRFGIFAGALTAATALSLCHIAHAQTFAIELINTPNAVDSFKIRDITDGKSLLIQRRDSQDRALDELYFPFSAANGTYLAPFSLSNIGFEPGALEQDGRFAVGSFMSRGAVFNLTGNLQATTPQTIHLATAATSGLTCAQNGYGAGWVRNANGGTRHAAEWGIINPIVVNDLHPSLVNALGADWINSEFRDIQTGNGYVGYGDKRNSGRHAMGLWGGVWVDLHPTNYISSEALTLYNDFQAGWGLNSQSVEQALVWQRTAASAISLNPAGYGNCRALEMDSDGIVGYGKLNMVDRATFWKRLPANPTGFGAFDLHQFVPAGASNSVAVGITNAGVIAGNFQLNGIWKPVLWHPIHLTSLTLSKTFFRGGTNVSATVRISRADPNRDIVIAVGPRNGLFLRTLVSAVTIPAGQTQATFTVQSSQVFSRVTASITATLGYESVSAWATLDPFLLGF